MTFAPSARDHGIHWALLRPWWGMVALVAAIFSRLSTGVAAEFIWDDDAHLTAHKCIVAPLGFKAIWTTSEANYFPLVLTTWWIVHQIVGLDPVCRGSFPVFGVDWSNGSDQGGRELDAAAHFTAAHANLALLLGRSRDTLAEAIVHGETAVQLKPDEPEAHFHLANNLAQWPGRSVEAIAHYETVLKLKPDHIRAHINLGLAYARIPGRLTDAIRHYNAALELDPRSAIAHNNLAIAFAESGRLAEALVHFARAVELDPNYTAARDNLERLKARRPQAQP